MKKALPLIIIGVVILGVGAWWFLGRGGGSLITLPGEVKKEAGEEGETFTGKMKDVIARGVPMKCTYSQGDYSGTTYIKGKKVYGEVVREGKTGYLIMVDNCMWSWEDNQGIKMCFDEDIWETDEEEVTGTVPIDAEYRCVPAVFSDSKFTPPSNVTFMSMEDLMQMGE